MAQITVTAPDGVRAKVRIQTKTGRHGYDEATGQPILGWMDTTIVEFASEAREFEVKAGQRIVVEDNPA